jgi:hypothetical protein
MQLTGDGKRELALVAAGLIVIGSFLPWIKVTTIFGSVTRAGFDTGDGKFTALLGVLAFAALFVEWGIVARLAGLVAGAIGVYDLVDVERIADEEAASVSSGYGLWIMIFGALVVLVQPALRRVSADVAVPSPPPAPLPPTPPA